MTDKQSVQADMARLEDENSRLRQLINSAPQSLLYPNAEWCEIYARWHRNAVRVAHFPHLPQPKT
ncbi:hypothetical protein [Methylobacterium nodulans]|uniref:Uncharacterized protein n=1 Tax=Methylobacterium nodulans (strain LMG 21967 / CNCM I-2342 / ORS 2060) TaxID=460265 RepID=B8ISK2_METNO|nr:hypothetical protein [Methylobacterium nodulans]ACL58842.1 hypothetical protein Mnod_3950 [Methylobacterium nodulans ORS 2060]